MLHLLWILSVVGQIVAKIQPLHQKFTPLISEFEWKYMDYLWESPEQKFAYIKGGLYKPQGMVPIDVDRSQDGRTFVTIIRSTGVPASLHTVSNQYGESGPLLIPYPNWSTYENSQACHGITSVFRVTIDKCNRLWVLDTGKIDDKYICPAQLLAYDLFTDRLITKITIPDNIARNGSGMGLLITPVVETYGYSCEFSSVYIADVTGHGLIVWSDGRFVRIENKRFNPEARDADYTIAGETFNLPDGLFGLALTPERYFEGNRLLFFRPLASRSIYAVRVDDLKSTHHPGSVRFHGSIDVLSSQATSMAFSDDGTLFYGLTRETAIGCWNLNKPLQSQNLGIPLIDKQRLQFASGLKVIKNQSSHFKGDDRLLIFTNRFQKVMTGSRNLNEINFRILSIAIKDLVRGTICENTDWFSWRSNDTIHDQNRKFRIDDTISSILPVHISDTRTKE